MKQIVILFIALISPLSVYCQVSNLDDGDNCFTKGDYACAEAKYKEVFKTAVGKDKQVIEIKIERAKRCNTLLQIAEKEFTNKNYNTAKENYLSILDSSPKDDYVKSQLEIIKDLLNKPKVITFSLSKTELSFDASGGSIYVDVALNLGSYTIDLLPSWCSIQKYDKFFIVYCNENITTSQRSVSLNATAGNKIIKINIVQKGIYQTAAQKREEELQKVQLAKRRLIAERRKIIEPYVKQLKISDDELAKLNEFEFNNKLIIAKNAQQIEDLQIDRYNKLAPYIGEVSSEVILKLGTYTDRDFDVIYNKAVENTLKIKEFEKQRRERLKQYILFVTEYDLSKLGRYSEQEFESIYNQARKTYRNSKSRSFSSIGFQSGELAKYGILYESGGKKTIGFRFSARTSLIPADDILTGRTLENKTELELGPNIKLFKGFYWNIGGGYGYYDKLIRNDYAGTLTIKKTGYSVATSGFMIRLNNVININGGAAFMDIDKDIYKPEITFGISFNLKGK